MAKIKLTDKQKQTIKQNKQKKLTEMQQPITNSMTLQLGRVINRQATKVKVELTTQEIITCKLRRSTQEVVVGDYVAVQIDTNHQPTNIGIVEAISTRQNELTRPDPYIGSKILAANIDQIVIVITAIPELDLINLDKYLIASNHNQIPALIVVNKIDLLTATQLHLIQETLLVYQQLGYIVILLSSHSGKNMQELIMHLKNKTSILTGQSGVGKTSILNKLLPKLDLKVQAVNELGIGKHTTTSSNLYHLDTGGDLIDSPGIREFGVWHLTEAQILNAYIEFSQFLDKCKYRNCQHIQEPQCAIIDAVKTGAINLVRFQNYLTLINDLTNNNRKTKRFLSK